MTDEERIKDILRVDLRPDGRIDWKKNDSGVVPMALESRIKEHLRAVREECYAAIANAAMAAVLELEDEAHRLEGKDSEKANMKFQQALGAKLLAGRIKEMMSTDGNDKKPAS